MNKQKTSKPSLFIKGLGVVLLVAMILGQQPTLAQMIPFAFFKKTIAQSSAIIFDGLWTWMSGSSQTPLYDYGSYNSTPGQILAPGGRYGAVTWTDTSGNLWLFGGNGIDTLYNTDLMNDLWKFDPTSGAWTWKGGAVQINQSGTYGTQGLGSTSNIPGSRSYSTSWVDGAGIFWLFGGVGYDSTGVRGDLNDLWKYNPSSGEWTWVAGSNLANQFAVYGTKGVAAPTNSPGARHGQNSWIDSNGNVWIFGGYGYLVSAGTSLSTGSGALNDLWKYSPSTNQWTWVSGTNLRNQSGTFGTQGVASALNVPGSRYFGASWLDASGNLWLFGGMGMDSIGGIYYQSDLWKYTPSTNQWTWVSGSGLINDYGTYGTKGTGATTNIPGARLGANSWMDTSGNLWLFGGNGYDSVAGSGSGPLNDLWKYTPSNNQWTWVGGGNTTLQYGVYAAKGSAVAANAPGARDYALAWTDSSGKLWLFGGSGVDDGTSIGYLSDLWMYSISTNLWTWRFGNKVLGDWPVYTFVVSFNASVLRGPGPRYDAVSWKDGSGNLWLFGGWGTDVDAGSSGSFNDLWEYIPGTNEWILLSAYSIPNPSINASGTYGTKGIGDYGNTPGSRSGSVSWIDSAGNLWLFGGDGYDSAGFPGRLNDLWKYTTSTGLWSWEGGSDLVNQGGTYGAIGIGATTNIPGARANSVSWIDSTGNLWLFGGYGFVSATSGYLSDLWEYTPSTKKWTYVSGTKLLDQVATYGTSQVGATTNTPGSRDKSISWIDSGGNLWLFGGYGRTTSTALGYLGDLWEYTPLTKKWAWMGGSNTIIQVGAYGTKGVGDVANIPGGRRDSSSWIDGSGNLWLFGGEGIDSGGGYAALNDLWEYTPSTKKWTWVAGSNLVNSNSQFGSQGVGQSSNTPSARSQSISGIDSSGNLWLFGGLGINGNNGTNDALNELWKYNPSLNQWTWVRGLRGSIYLADYFGTQGVPSSTKAPPPRDGSVSWTDNSGNLWLFGGRIDNYYWDGYADLLNDLWKYTPSTNEWTWVSGSNLPNQLSIFTSQGVPAVTNSPSGRYNSVGWIDSSGNFWLFGGFGFSSTGLNSGNLNDLWKYSPTSGEWTFVNGSISGQIDLGGIYGSLGIGSTANRPGGREGSASWKDSSGNLWLFGGYGYDSTAAANYMNDLWKYSPTTGEWTWMSGSDLILWTGTYGSKGVSAPMNSPGARAWSGSWVDKNGHFWLFGGSGNGATLSGDLNDLWQYSPATGEWTWMSGSDGINQGAVMGANGIGASTNAPGSKWGMMTWLDSSGEFWLFGGVGNAGQSNDLWKYSPSTNQWTWYSGADSPQLGSYGEIGVGSIANSPGSRWFGVTWTDSNGNFWLFGGFGHDASGTLGTLNDLWKVH